jgi:hypothetical protein
VKQLFHILQRLSAKIETAVSLFVVVGLQGTRINGRDSCGQLVRRIARVRLLKSGREGAVPAMLQNLQHVLHFLRRRNAKIETGVSIFVIAVPNDFQSDAFGVVAGNFLRGTRGKNQTGQMGLIA